FTRPETRTIRPGAPGPLRTRLVLEGLEDRCCPSNFTVTNTLDDGSVGSLRWAVNQANINPGADTIQFAFGSAQTITLTGTQLELSDTTGVTTIADPASRVTVSGDGSLSRVFQIDGGVTAVISGLTITGGYSPENFPGGGLANFGTVTLTDCTISGNTSVDPGGGIYNSGTATLTNCTISGNSTPYSDGGGIYNDNATLTLTNCTISGNTSFAYAGGLYNSGFATVTNCTISGNSTVEGGGLYTISSATFVNNSIIAGNTAGIAPDVSTLNGVASQGHNLIGITDGSSGWIGSDLTGTGASPLDPKLAPLGSNG